MVPEFADQVVVWVWTCKLATHTELLTGENNHSEAELDGCAKLCRRDPEALQSSDGIAWSHAEAIKPLTERSLAVSATLRVEARSLRCRQVFRYLLNSLCAFLGAASMPLRGGRGVLAPTDFGSRNL